MLGVPGQRLGQRLGMGEDGDEQVELSGGLVEVMIEDVRAGQCGHQPLETDQRPIRISRLLAGADQMTENLPEVATFQRVRLQPSDGCQHPPDVSKSPVAHELLRGLFR